MKVMVRVLSVILRKDGVVNYDCILGEVKNAGKPLCFFEEIAFSQ